MIAYVKARLARLKPWQAATVLVVLMGSAIAAVTLAWAFARWNERKAA